MYKSSLIALYLPCVGNCLALVSSTLFHKLAILLVTCFFTLPFEATLTLLWDLCAGLGMPDLFPSAPFVAFGSFFKLWVDEEAWIFFTDSRLSALVDLPSQIIARWNTPIGQKLMSTCCITVRFYSSCRRSETWLEYLTFHWACCCLRRFCSGLLGVFAGQMTEFWMEELAACEE